MSIKVWGLMFALMPSVLSAAAQDWVVGIERGLESHTLEANGWSVRLYCDPDNVFESAKSNASLQISRNGVRFSGPVLLSSAGGQHVELTLQDGGFYEGVADEPTWAAMIAIIENGGEMTFAAQSENLIVSTPTLSELRCIAD